MTSKELSVSSLIAASRMGEDVLEPKVGRARRSSGGAKAPSLTGQLKKRLGRVQCFGVSRDAGGRSGFRESYASDPRQRSVVKVHYFAHGGGGGAALRAHGRYIDRETERETGRDVEREIGPEEARGHADDQVQEREASKLREHEKYLSRDERVGFYDRERDRVEGRERLAEWSRADARHFRIVLAPENGEGIKDLPGYTREVMERAEQALGRGPLQWVAVDHWDTANPHTHIVLRGRCEDGRNLGLPRDFVRHQFREIARDVATERIGPRGREEERLALEREARAHRLTRLDRLIEERLGRDQKVRLASLGRDIGDPALAQAMKTRAVELQRLGLAEEVRRGVLRLSPDWRERLQGMERDIDIRKRLMHDRTIDREKLSLSREAGKPFREVGELDQTWKVRGIREIGGDRWVQLERWDSVSMMRQPRGMDVQRDQSLRLQMERGRVKVKGLDLGLDR